MKPIAALAAAGLLASALAVRAQSTMPGQAPVSTFRGGVEVVDVDVSVLDRNRRPVRDLTAADFTVLEDGKPRPVAAFTPVDLAPREMPSARWLGDVAPDAQTNDLQREGRLVMLLIDRTVAPADAETALSVAEGAIDQLRPADLAAVVFTEYGIPQNFTSDRRRLLAAVRQPLATSGSSRGGSCYCGTCTLDRVSALAEAVRDVRQRRKLLFIIGSSITVTLGGACSSAVTEARERAFRAVGAANLTVYAFDPSGLYTPPTNAAVRSPAGRGGLANLRRMGNLMLLPDQTGGRAVFGNDPAETVPEIYRESNSYYVLGFHPAHTDGAFHKIAVKVNRPGVTLQARRGYYAAGGKPRKTPAPPAGIPAVLQQAVAGLWPKTGLGLTLATAPVAMPGLRAAAVAVMLGVDVPAALRDVGFNDDGGTSATPSERPVRVLVGAFDREGQPFAYSQGTFAATPRRRPDGSLTYDLLSRLELIPGRYEIRAAVEDTAADEIGSVYGYVDVPSYAEELVTLSGIILYTSPADPIGLLNNALHSPLEVVPTLRRRFSRGDRVSAWLQIAQGVQRPVMPGYVNVEIVDEHDTRVFHQETRTLAEDVGANRAINLKVDLPLETLHAGEYLLSVEVRQGNASAQRDVRFGVR